MSAYAKFLEPLIAQAFDGVTVKALLVDEDYEPSASDEFVADVSSFEISGAPRATATDVAVSLDVDTGELSVTSADVVFPGLAALDDLGGIVFYVDTGDDSTSRLISNDIEGPITTPAGDLTYHVDDASGFLSIGT